MIKISAIIITYNEEKSIARCLDSVAPVADEILVIDSFSKDFTKKICLAKGARFIEHRFEGHIQQKNFALSQAKFDYVLSVDADEYLSPELTNSILTAKKLWPAEAYEMNRLSSYGGRWMKLSAWYPDKKIRLWNKKAGAWGGGNPHDKVVLNKKTKVFHLPGNLMHEAYDNAAEFLVKVQAYSDIFARENRYIVKSSSFKIFYKTFYSFIFNFSIKLGFFGGYEGAMISISNSNYTFYKYSKLLEANRRLGISLIIKAPQQSEVLEAVLQSLMRQSVLPDEVIIADNGLGCEIPSVIESLQSNITVPLVYCGGAHLGPEVATAQVKAINLARHEYIIMVDGDIMLHNDFVKDHKAKAWKGQYVLGQMVFMDLPATQAAIKRRKIAAGLMERMNILSQSFSNLMAGQPEQINLSCWKEDLLGVNSFASVPDLVSRMHSEGVRQKKVKFGAIGYQLYHPENTVVDTAPVSKLKIAKIEKAKSQDCLFSIVIPTWNNLPYLKLCVESIRKNSSYHHQIIVHVNEGLDGSLEWIKQQPDIDYAFSEKNIGVCYALNGCRSLVKTPYILFINDDMYVCPQWDHHLKQEIDAAGTELFFLSSTAVEPVFSSNCAIQKDYGRNPEAFQEEKFLQEFESLPMRDWSGSTWPPNIVHVNVWDLVGGYSTEFTPGLYSDPDFSLKLWNLGVRLFKGVSKSRVYHFGSKSVKRIKKNAGYYKFIGKWGMTSSTLTKYLHRGEPFIGSLSEPKLGSGSKIKNVLKGVASVFIRRTFR